MKTDAKRLLSLFAAFAKIGMFTFGGGYAMVALIESECVEKRKWLTDGEMAASLAIAESTPGPIAINCATYTGYRQAGMAGAAAATVGMVLPSFVILFAISMFFDRFLEIRWIASAFAGIRVGVGVLIAQAGVNMLLKMKKTPLSVSLMAGGLAAMLVINFFALKISTVWLLAAAALVSTAVFRAKKTASGKEARG